MSVVEFKKADSGKPRWSLIPWDALLGILHVMEYGAEKYTVRDETGAVITSGANNWALGADWSRYWDALQRHLKDWWLGEKADPETGRSHLLHAGACLLFLIAYEMRGIGKDDRPKLSVESPPERQRSDLGEGYPAHKL